jgi:2-C-methyl-D-erythritol 4-phosphate cytidylyltransferase
MPLAPAAPPTPADEAPRYYALVPCAGTGSRAGTARPKQYEQVAGEPLVMHTLKALAAVERLHAGLVALSPEDDFAWPENAAWPGMFVRAHCGGSTRAHTVLNGLQALRSQGAHDTDWVLVHDAARCLITADMVNSLIDACASDSVGGLLALLLPDTLKQSVAGRVAHTVPRDDKWLAQTPQMFRLGLLQDALQEQAANGFADVTDEASALEMAGHQPLLVVGSAYNFKVTYPQDFALAQAVLAIRSATSQKEPV